MVRYLTILTVLMICAGEVAAQDDGLARAETLAEQGSEFQQQGRYDEAIPLTSEALEIREKALGPDHPDIAKSLNNLAALYVRKGRFAEAEPLYQRAIRIVEKALGPDDPDIASILSNLGELYRLQSLYSEAETMLRRSLAIREKAFGAEDPKTARSLNNLATLFFAQGRFSETESLFERSLAIWQKALGPDHPEVATALNNLGVLYNDQGHYEKAESAYRRSLEISEKTLGPEHPTIADIGNNLAQIYAAQARYNEAEPLLRRSLAIREISFGATHPKAAESLNNIAQLYSGRGRDAEAEPLYRRSLAIYEGALGPDHPDIAMSLSNLAAVYVSQGRSDQAEPLFRRSLEIREKALGPHHPDVALTLNNLATVYQTEQRASDAEPLYRRSLAIWETAFGPKHPDLGRGLNNLAKLYLAERRYAEAEALFKRSLALFESIFGTEHPMVALSLNNLAALYSDDGRNAEAEPLFKRSLAIYTKEFGHQHYDNVQAMWNLAAIYRQQERIAEARRLSAEALNIVRGRISAAENTRSDTSRGGDQHKFRELFLLNVVLEYEYNARSLPIGFDVAQLAKASTAAKAVAGMSARFAAGSDALAIAVRERQDLVQRWQTLDAGIIKAASKPPVQRDAAAEAALRSQFDETGMKIDALDSRIAREFPAYAELSNPKPLDLTDAQGLLASDEAMLVYLVGRNQSWVWVLRRDTAELHPIEIGDKALATEVSALRERLDPDRNPDLAPFPATRAHALYEKLMAPAAPLLQGATQIFVVPDGAIESLPLSVLVTRAPAGDPETLIDHRDLAWLARDHAVIVLPSVGALRGLRQLADARRADEPFIGIGNPVLNGAPDQTRGKKPGQLFRAAGANVDAIRALPPLPETEDELRTVAKALGAHEQDLYLAERASEPLVRAARLDRYRIVEFATHGLVSGDLPGLTEPALVLTPPNEATPENDGLLTASKIATLKLNADWVVLSACNTAAGDGTPDAGGLSGLAKAFFYAGARSVLVSHWSVPSKAAVQLITAAFERLEKEPKIGRAEALRLAEMAMLDPGNPPEFAHPLAWAPFVLAGEGGAGR